VQFYVRILLPSGSGPLVGPAPHSHHPEIGFRSVCRPNALNPCKPTRNLVTSTPFRPTHTMDSLTHTAEIPRTSKKFLSFADHPPWMMREVISLTLNISTDEFPQHGKRNKQLTRLPQQSLSTLILFLVETHPFTKTLCPADFTRFYRKRA
jgi:hypothetical protein